MLRKVAFTALVAATMIIGAAVPGTAAPNIYGTGGLIEVPDDTIFPVGTVTPAYHGVFNTGNEGDNLNFLTVGIGLLPNLDISGGAELDGDSAGLLNAKYRALTETGERPSVTVGVIDAFGDLETSKDAGLFIVIGKTLTATAEDVVNGESKPLRGYLGYGTGALEGPFVGLNWALAPKLAAMLEYLHSDVGPLDDGTHFNGGLRFALTNELRVDASLIDFNDFSIGVSYNSLRF